MNIKHFSYFKVNAIKNYAKKQQQRKTKHANKQKKTTAAGICLLQVFTSLSTRSVIGQFCGLYFIVQPTSFHFLHARLTSEIITVNILLTSFSRSIL